MIHLLKDKEVSDHVKLNKMESSKYPWTSCVALMRLRKDMEELSYKSKRFCARGTIVKIQIPHGEGNQTAFTCTLTPAEGPFAHGTFVFALKVPHTYPYHPPCVKCLTKVFHPNFDFRTGAVYLPILTDGWRPVLTMNTVIFSLQLLFLEPVKMKVCHEAILNAEANRLKQEFPLEYEKLVRATMGGGDFFGEFWAPTLRNGPLGEDALRGKSVRKSCSSALCSNPSKKRRLSNIVLSDLRHLNLSDSSSSRTSSPQSESQLEEVNRKRSMGDDYDQHTEFKKRCKFDISEELSSPKKGILSLNMLREFEGVESKDGSSFESSMMMDEDS